MKTDDTEQHDEWGWFVDIEMSTPATHIVIHTTQGDIPFVPNALVGHPHDATTEEPEHSWHNMGPALRNRKVPSYHIRQPTWEKGPGDGCPKRHGKPPSSYSKHVNYCKCVSRVLFTLVVVAFVFML